MSSGYKISKEFHFSASHQLMGLPEQHQCARLHGHNYIVKVTLYGDTLNDVGFIMDYGDLGFVKDMVDQIDHRHLNDLFPDFNPTAENMCRWFWKEIREEFAIVDRSHDNVKEVAVSISETPKTWATYHEAI
jgi:6-pyruvoyltetrahydropterin/6-carboxytetrahydropterin synthase